MKNKTIHLIFLLFISVLFTCCKSENQPATHFIGDYLIIQFGHNDGSERKVARYTTPEEYRYNLIHFENESRKKGAIPVLCTHIVRRRFNSDGEFYDTHGTHPEIIKYAQAAS